MKCPNCGSKLKADVYRDYSKKKAVAEVESAYKWNETLSKGE